MEKPLSPRSAAKRAAMLDAAQACFLEHGYSSTSVDEVAARAGVSKATIYAHFNSKDDLFGAIICRRCDDQAEGLSLLALPESGDSRVLLTALARRLMKLFLAPEVMGIYRMVVAEAGRHPELAKSFYEAGPSRGKVHLIELFDELRNRGALRHADSWLACDQLVGMLRGDCFQRALLGLPPNVGMDAERTIEAAVSTLLAAYGSVPSPAAAPDQEPSTLESR